RVVALLPVHPARREWGGPDADAAAGGIRVMPLAPEEWHKSRLLEPEAAEGRLQEYFRQRHYASARVVPSATADRLNAELERDAEGMFGPRLKRVYEVRLRTPAGTAETRFVVAKSVGWGWLGYHAFFAGDELGDLVP